MFVKWQSRQKWGGVLLMASVVESKRVDGKPRHKLITYLGSIRENHAQGDPKNAVRQDDFWQHVSKKLNQASNRITTEDRAKIEAALAKRVERPTQAEIDQLLADTRKKIVALRNINGVVMNPDPTEQYIRDRAY